MMERRLAAILTADVVGYSRLIRADEEGTIAAVRALREELINPKIDKHNGRIVKLMGDGILAEFPSVVDTVYAAVEIQQAVANHNTGLPDNNRIEFRVGINLGDVVIDGDDIHGDGVNVAARLEALSEPGGICISGKVYEEVRDRTDFAFQDLGEQEVKNINRPVQVWRWSPEGSGTRGTVPVAEPPVGSARIVILPFDNMSSDASNEHLADGLSEDLTTALSKIDTFDVVSRTAAFALKGRQISAADTARKLGAGYAVEGSVRTSGNRVRFNAQLIDSETGGQIWAEKYDGSLDDVFGLQDAITQQIVTAIEVHLSDGDQVILWHTEADDPKAYDYFLAGRNAYKEYSREGNMRARRNYQAALQISPKFASALAGLARTYIEDATFHWATDHSASLEEARRLLGQAFAIVPDHALARAEIAHALMEEGKFQEGKLEAKRAVETDPSLADAHHVLSTLHVCLGEHEQALRRLKQCEKLNPATPEFYEVNKVEALTGLKRYKEAQSVARSILARRPEWLMVHALAAIAAQALNDNEATAAAIAQIRSQNQRFTVSRWRKQIFYPNRADVPEWCDLLVRAGLPA
jgi:adenylate cyclase